MNNQHYLKSLADMEADMEVGDFSNDSFQESDIINCHYCQAPCHGPDAYDDHVENSHPQVLPPQNLCPRCGQSWPSKESLGQHQGQCKNRIRSGSFKVMKARTSSFPSSDGMKTRRVSDKAIRTRRISKRRMNREYFIERLQSEGASLLAEQERLLQESRERQTSSALASSPPPDAMNYEPTQQGTVAAPAGPIARPTDIRRFGGSGSSTGAPPQNSSAKSSSKTGSETNPITLDK